MNLHPAVSNLQNLETTLRHCETNLVSQCQNTLKYLDIFIMTKNSNFQKPA